MIADPTRPENSFLRPLAYPAEKKPTQCQKGPSTVEVAGGGVLKALTANHKVAVSCPTMTDFLSILGVYSALLGVY